MKSVTGNEADGHLPVPRPVGLVPKSKVGGGVVGRFREAWGCGLDSGW